MERQRPIVGRCRLGPSFQVGQGNAVVVVDLRLLRGRGRCLSEQPFGRRILAARVGRLACLVELGPAGGHSGHDDRREREQSPDPHANLFSA
jgi:hypothetical protein